MLPSTYTSPPATASQIGASDSLKQRVTTAAVSAVRITVTSMAATTGSPPGTTSASFTNGTARIDGRMPFPE